MRVIIFVWNSNRNVGMKFTQPFYTIKDMTIHYDSKLQWGLYCYKNTFLYGFMFMILSAVSLLGKISYLHPNTKWRVLDGRVLRSIKMCQDNQYWSDLNANIIFKKLKPKCFMFAFLDYILLIFAKSYCPALNQEWAFFWKRGTT